MDKSLDIEAVRTAIRSWTIEDRFRLIGAVWDDLTEENQPSELSKELRDLLDDRIEAFEKNPEAVVPWEVVEAQALKRFGP